MIAIVLLFLPMVTEDVVWAIAGLMGAAMIFDFADGLVARALKVASPIGKELDSLADVVTFGVLPGLLVFFMMANWGTHGAVSESGWHTTIYEPWVFYCFIGALLIPLLSAYRLAKFNVDERQGNVFYGIATPMNAFFWLSIFLYFNFDLGDSSPEWVIQMFTPVGLAIAAAVMSILLVVDIPLMAMKFKSYGFKENAAKYIFLLSAVVLLVIFFYKAVPLILILYFIFSFIDNRLNKHEIPG